MATITTTTADFAWRPDESTFAPADIVPAALILQTSTVSGDINGDQPSLHVGFVVDAESAEYIAEGAPITDDEPGLDEVLVKTKKVSRLVTLSSEQFDKPETATQVALSLARDIIRKADASYLGDNGTGGAPMGLLHHTEIVDGDPVAGNLDALIDLIAVLEQNGATPSAIVTSPPVWAALRRLKVGGSNTNESLLGAGTTDATPMLLSLPILRSRFIPANSGLVIDKSAIASAVGPVKTAVSEHAKFANDAVVLRATWRIGWNLVRPERIGRFVVDEGGS
ncbi:phage major capsid protein [Mycobacterium sp. 23]|uniref:phage major capsid protein n=1 Tax=Mycobacterium sp. 23 TaxID=3400424 RepID=UPI003AAFA19A